MKETFLFGKFYSKDELKEISSIMDSKTPYEINKNTFISEMYENKGTIEKSYNYFKNHTIVVEKIKGKDLMYFTVSELINLMNSLTTTSINTKKRIYDLIKTYLDWAVYKKYIPINNMNGLSKDDLCKINKKIASYKYTDIKTLDKLCEDAIKNEWISVIDIIPLIISRYGILGKKMSKLLNLHWGDINSEDMNVKIIDGDSISIYPIDDIFLKWIYRAKDCNKHGDIEYVDEGKVVKRLQKFNELDISIINNRLTRVFQTTYVPRSSLKSLEFSRKIDLLLNTREERVLNSTDFRELTVNFDSNISPASTNALIKEYESLTGDMVQPLRSKNKVKYVDNNPKETVKKIKKNLGVVTKAK